MVASAARTALAFCSANARTAHSAGAALTTTNANNNLRPNFRVVLKGMAGRDDRTLGFADHQI